MPKYGTADIRNIALVGHSGSGKTSLAEAILHTTGTTSRLGSVPDGSSHLDFTEEERERTCSIDAAVCHVSHDGKEINIIDTPGTPDFVGPAIAALAAVETAVCVISASAGIEVNTRRMMEKAKEHGLGRMIVINKMDADNVNFAELLGQITETFGMECQPMNLPTGGTKGVVDCFASEDGDADVGSVADAHTAVVEGIVGVDDALMEKYFAGDLSPDELSAAAAQAVAAGSLVPMLFTNARGVVGIKELLDALLLCAPSPVDGLQRKLDVEGDERPIEPKADGPFIAQVFKVSGDPKSNIKYSALRIHSGTLAHDLSLMADDRKNLRPGQLHKMQGGEHPEIEAGIPGDIIALAKLDLHIGNVLHTGTPGAIPLPPFPSPMFALAVEPKSRGDGDKVSVALARFTDEDPCFGADRDSATNELVIRGVGDLHLRTILSRMKRFFKLEVNTKPPRIPYRETITGSAKEIEYTHKKQSGGAGQFARVIISIEPNPGEGYVFEDLVHGRNVEPEFRPSVNKGIQAQMTQGVVAGYPVVDVKAQLIDGKTHPVDSKDIAFQIAAREAFKIAFDKARPVLLEPIVNMEVTIPVDSMGDIQGDLSSRRGRVQGQDMLPGGFTTIKAQIPLAEVSDYNSRLSSMTGGQGSYAMELSHYEQVPSNVQQQVIDAAKREKEEAK